MTSYLDTDKTFPDLHLSSSTETTYANLKMWASTDLQLIFTNFEHSFPGRYSLAANVLTTQI